MAKSKKIFFLMLPGRFWCDERFWVGDFSLGRTQACGAYFASVTKVFATCSFFQKKRTKKIAAVEALAEFHTQKPSENQAASTRWPTRAQWFSFARKSGAGFYVRNSPARIIFSVIWMMAQRRQSFKCRTFSCDGRFFFLMLPGSTHDFSKCSTATTSYSSSRPVL